MVTFRDLAAAPSSAIYCGHDKTGYQILNTVATTADFTDARAKHLGMIQDVVARMASSSASTKRIAIIVVGGAAAVAARGNWEATDLLRLAIILVAVLWLIDVRYVQRERWFRDLYDIVAAEPPDRRPDFRITPPDHIKDGRGFWGAARSWSTTPYYAALAGFLYLAWSAIS